MTIDLTPIGYVTSPREDLNDDGWGDVVARIDSFPRVLMIEDQGLFALGYYHQRAASRAEARAAADARRAGATNADTTQGESLPEEE